MTLKYICELQKSHVIFKCNQGIKLLRGSNELNLLSSSFGSLEYLFTCNSIIVYLHIVCLNVSRKVKKYIQNILSIAFSIICSTFPLKSKFFVN